MQTFESIFIIRPTLTDEEVNKVVEKMKGVIQKNGGTVMKAEIWGKRRMAYDVKKEKKGIYVVVHFNGDGKVIRDLEHHYRVEDAVIKFMTVKIDPGRAGHLPMASSEEGRSSRPKAVHE